MLTAAQTAALTSYDMIGFLLIVALASFGFMAYTRRRYNQGKEYAEAEMRLCENFTMAMDIEEYTQLYRSTILRLLVKSLNYECSYNTGIQDAVRAELIESNYGEIILRERL
jgi:hypothetical protein